MQCQSLPWSQELPECGCRALLFVQRLCWRFDRVQHFLELFCSFLFIHHEAVTSLCTWVIMSLDFSIYSTRVLICSCRMLSCSWSLLLLGVFVLASRFSLVGFEVVADEKVFIKFREDLDFIVGEHGTFRGGGVGEEVKDLFADGNKRIWVLVSVASETNVFLFISVVIFIRWACWDKRGMKSWETFRALVDGTVQQKKVQLVLICWRLASSLLVVTCWGPFFQFQFPPLSAMDTHFPQ